MKSIRNYAIILMTLTLITAQSFGQEEQPPREKWSLETIQGTVNTINKETRENEAKNPEEAAALLNRLFKFEVTPDILNDYHKLISFLKTNLNEEDYKNVISKYLRILDLTRADIPNDLQQFWIDNQERLQLTGKYLPDNSNLLQYKK